MEAIVFRRSKYGVLFLYRKKIIGSGTQSIVLKSKGFHHNILK